MRETVSPPNLVCDHCHAHFRRREHLDRHTRRHLELRPFPCQWCSKSFSRKDSLKRHVTTHGPNAVRSYEHTATQEAKRVSRACLKCTKSKQRCDGQQPCDRCQKKRFACEYSISLSAGSEGHRSTSRQSLPAAPMDPVQPDAYHQSTALPNRTSLGNYGITQPADLMDHIFNPFPFMTVDNVDPTLGGFSAPFFLDPSLQSAGFLNEHVQPLPFGAPNMPPLNDSNQYTNGDSSTGLSAFGSSNAPPTDSQSMNPAKETTNSPGEHNAQRRASTSSFSDLVPDEQEIIITEDFCHVEHISEGAYNAIVNFYREHCQKPNTPQATLPSIQVVNAFIQLYFEYFHPFMPIVHLPSFKPTPDKWILLVSIASVGCQYSRVPTKSQMHSFFWHLLQRFILKIPMQRLLRNDEVHLAQAVLLHNLSLFDGSQNIVYTMQYQRNILVTLCRPFIVGHASPLTRLSSVDLKDKSESWSNWVLSESWKRVIYFTWVFECFQWILFDLPPVLAIWELRIGLPGHDALWECADSTEWEHHSRTQDDPISLVNLFGSLKTNNQIQSLGQTTRLIIMISLFSEEKRFRKQTQCLPYSSLLSSTDSSLQETNLIPDILASKFEHFRSSKPPSAEHSTLSLQQQKLYHFFSILRHIPTHTMFASYGWMTTNSDAEIAESKVAELLANVQRARQSLVHAASLFRLIREHNVVAFYDPFCLLIAAQYICKYTRHVIEKFHQGLDNSTPLASGQPIRIDRLNVEEQDAWIQRDWQGADEAPIHVTGIGVLEKRGSSSRAFKEAARTLRGSVSWAKISQGIARAMVQSLRGETLSISAS